jgi:hypothetical protein
MAAPYYNNKYNNSQSHNQSNGSSGPGVGGVPQRGCFYCSGPHYQRDCPSFHRVTHVSATLICFPLFFLATKFEGN